MNTIKAKCVLGPMFNCNYIPVILIGETHNAGNNEFSKLFKAPVKLFTISNMSYRNNNS